MSQMMMSVVVAMGLLSTSAGPASAQSVPEGYTYGYVTEGKNTVRKVFRVRDEKDLLPKTVRIEVKPEDRQPGDDWGYKTVGKHTERVYYREVERKPEVAKTTCGGDCSYGYFTETGKRTERRIFCDLNGHRTFCGHASGECSRCMEAK